MRRVREKECAASGRFENKRTEHQRPPNGIEGYQFKADDEPDQGIEESDQWNTVGNNNKKNKKRKSVTLRALLGLSAQQATSAASFPGCGVSALTACARQCMSSHRWWTIARRCCQINFSSRRAGTLKPRKNVLFAERHFDKNAFLVILFSFQQNRCACACTSGPAFAGVQL